MKKILVYLLLFCGGSVAAQRQHYLLIGTYTNGKSEGIYVYKFNSETGENQFQSVVKTSNPSYLAVSPNQKYVYAVNENADSSAYYVGGNISAFAFKNGILSPINKKPSGGKHPCYVAVDNSGRWVFAGNYTSGSIGLLHANADGSLENLQQTIQHKGQGPNAERQQGPHVHSTNLSPNNEYLYVADLGTDKLMVYKFDKIKGRLTFKSSASSIPGNGPRHLAFSADNKFAYLAEEMGSAVVCYGLKNDQLIFKQRIGTLPKDFTGTNTSADIHISPDGKFLYCSNRGDANSITIYAINKTNGQLSLAGYQSTLGKTPRNFNFDPSGNFLLVANQNSDEVVIFKRNVQTGLLTDTGKRINVGNPVCLKWIR